MTKSYSILLYFFISFLTLTGSADLACQETSPHTNKSMGMNRELYLGVASCASSACHGGTAPRKNANVSQNEYSIWFRHDAHSKAYSTLLSAESKIIGKHLGIEHPEKSDTCLSCHSTQVPKELQHKKFRISDGVGCESCHGPASTYIKSHTINNRSHEDNIRDGLKDLISPEKRAELCLSCHQGTDEKYVNHRLIGAGHPRLRFELDTYSILLPRHWKNDEKYERRKGKHETLRHWLTGQAKHARQLVNSTHNISHATQAGVPEFSNYYCYSCHHSLKEEQWKYRSYDNKPGEITRNTASLQMLHLALEELDQNLALKLKDLTHVYQKIGFLDNQNHTIQEITTLIDNEILPLLSTLEMTKEISKKILYRILKRGATYSFLPYEVAEHYAMGISALTSELDSEGKFYGKKITHLYETLKDEKQFTPEHFTKAVKSLLGDLEQSDE